MSEKHLNIYMFAIAYFFRWFSKKSFPFVAVVVSCQGNGLAMDGHSREPLEMTFFFTNAHAELVRAHTTGSETDFTKLIQKITPHLKRYASKLVSRRPLGSIGVDDYVQVGVIAIWRFMPGFKYFCPLCDERFTYSVLYTNHCMSIHGREVEPVKTLEQWLTYEVKRYMANALRSHVRRLHYTGLEINNLSSEDDLFNRSFPRPDEMAVSNQIVARIKELIKREPNKRLKSFVQGCVDDKQPADIFRSMVSEGLSGSTQSARVGVRSLRKRPNIWRLYRQALTG